MLMCQVLKVIDFYDTVNVVAERLPRSGESPGNAGRPGMGRFILSEISAGAITVNEC